MNQRFLDFKTHLSKKAKEGEESEAAKLIDVIETPLYIGNG